MNERLPQAGWQLRRLRERLRVVRPGTGKGDPCVASAGRGPREATAGKTVSGRTSRSHTFMVELRVQELARKCLNCSRLLDPHGRCAGAAPGSHRQDTVGAGRTQWRPRRRTGRSTIRLVWLCTQGISPGMTEG